MKVFPFQIPKPRQDALVYQEDHEYVFYDRFHQHKEIQISCIVKGSGTLIVGDSVSDYTRGDILVIGGNIPHVFKSDKDSVEKSVMLSLFFTKAAFGPHFFELEELKVVLPFFKKSESGFKVLSHRSKLESMFTDLKSASKLDRFVLLLNILQQISKSKVRLLSSFTHHKTYTAAEGKRMQDVMGHTINNFQENITLEEIAKVSAMTKNAFCKYFKKRTNKTYFQFLNELRIENAGKLLLNSELSIADIAYQCGFRNISNFNRQFLALKQKTPSQYRLAH